MLLIRHPLYAIAVVLAAFLVFAGLGSRYSQRYADSGRQGKGIRLAVSGLIVLGLVYLALLGPLFSLLLALPTLAKVAITITLIAPLGACPSPSV